MQEVEATQETNELNTVTSEQTPEANMPENSETTPVETTETVETEKLKEAQAVIAYLAEKFPLCFSIKGAAKPLKIGIFKDLAERLAEDNKVSKTVLRGALRKYTSSWRYLGYIKLDADRVDLDGNPVAKIEAEHADYAQEQLTQSKQKVAERRKLQKPAKKQKDNGDISKADKFKQKVKSPTNTSAKSSAKVQKDLPAKKVIKARDNSQPLTVGEKVQIMMGSSPVDCTVQAINNNDVTVMTISGMTIRTEKKKIL